MERPLTLYVREGCHLCEDALRLVNDLGVRTEIVDITGRAGLEALYGERVPVLARGDTVIAWGEIAPDVFVDL